MRTQIGLSSALYSTVCSKKPQIQDITDARDRCCTAITCLSSLQWKEGAIRILIRQMDTSDLFHETWDAGHRARFL